jgi:hypothetical protein
LKNTRTREDLLCELFPTMMLTIGIGDKEWSIDHILLLFLLHFSILVFLLFLVLMYSALRAHVAAAPAMLAKGVKMLGQLIVHGVQLALNVDLGGGLLHGEHLGGIVG